MNSNKIFRITAGARPPERKLGGNALFDFMVPILPCVGYCATLEINIASKLFFSATSLTATSLDQLKEMELDPCTISLATVPTEAHVTLSFNETTLGN